MRTVCRQSGLPISNVFCMARDPHHLRARISCLFLVVKLNRLALGSKGCLKIHPYEFTQVSHPAFLSQAGGSR